MGDFCNLHPGREEDDVFFKGVISSQTTSHIPCFLARLQNGFADRTFAVINFNEILDGGSTRLYQQLERGVYVEGYGRLGSEAIKCHSITKLEFPTSQSIQYIAPRSILKRIFPFFGGK